MGLLERIKRWLPRSFESVAAEIADGLMDGTVVLDSPAEASADPAEPASCPQAAPADVRDRPPVGS